MADTELTDQGYVKLALAIVGQAATDAKKGDIEAALYLVGPGCDILEAANQDTEAARRFVSNRFGWPMQALQPIGSHP